MDKILKLSDAVRLGSKLKPQCFGALFRRDGSCALGAVADVMGFAYDSDTYRLLDKRFPELQTTLATYENCALNKDLKATIIMLNDTLKWTRERIADWLEEQGY